MGLIRKVIFNWNWRRRKSLSPFSLRVHNKKWCFIVPWKSAYGIGHLNLVHLDQGSNWEVKAPAKGGSRSLLARSDTLFRRRSHRKIGNGLLWHILGATGSENFVKFRWFNKNSPVFVEFEDFITWKCIVMHKMTKKSRKIGLYRLFYEIS